MIPWFSRLLIMETNYRRLNFVKEFILRMQKCSCQWIEERVEQIDLEGKKSGTRQSWGLNGRNFTGPLSIAMLLSWRGIFPLGDVWLCMEIFLIVMTQETVCYWHLVGGGQGWGMLAGKGLVMPRTVPHISKQHYVTPNLSTAEVEGLCSRSTRPCHQPTVSPNL